MRKRKVIYALSAFLLLGGVSVVGLTSCGPSEPDGQLLHLLVILKLMVLLSLYQAVMKLLLVKP